MTVTAEEGLLSPDSDINDRDAFVAFLVALAQDARHHPESWQRTDVATYLEVMAHYLANDLGAFYRNWRGESMPEAPTWRLVADLLGAARSVYEDWDVEP